MRGFTAFSETAEPEDVMAVLREYHGALGPLIHRYEGTLDRFTGDGLIVFFNDPVPCPDPALRAVRLAVEMREAVASLARSWTARGHEIGFGVGIAQGYATLGRIGFEGRFDYTAIGTVTNLAARLCAEARDGQILVTQRVAAAIDSIAELEQLGDIALKGLSRPVAVLNVSGLAVEPVMPARSTLAVPLDLHVGEECDQRMDAHRGDRRMRQALPQSRVRGSSIAKVRCWVGCGVVVIKVTPSGASKRCHAPCGTITTIPAFSAWDCGPSSVMM